MDTPEDYLRRNKVTFVPEGHAAAAKHGQKADAPSLHHDAVVDQEDSTSSADFYASLITAPAPRPLIADGDHEPGKHDHECVLDDLMGDSWTVRRRLRDAQQRAALVCVESAQGPKERRKRQQRLQETALVSPIIPTTAWPAGPSDRRSAYTGDMALASMIKERTSERGPAQTYMKSKFSNPLLMNAQDNDDASFEAKRRRISKPSASKWDHGEGVGEDADKGGDLQTKKRKGKARNDSRTSVHFSHDPLAVTDHASGKANLSS